MLAAAALPATLERGSGDTALFLLHGVGGGKQAWAGNLAAIADARYRAIAWDMPGYGASATVEPYRLATLAASLRRLIQHSGARRVLLVGHSMGGMVAQEFVATWPGEVHGLILSGTSPAFGRADGDWQRQFLQDRFAPLDAGRTMAQLAESLVPGMMAAGAEPRAVAAAAAVMANVPESSYRAALQAIVAFDRRADLPGITVPTLCLAGEHDRNAPPQVMQRMAATIPGAAYQCLEGVGHLANIENPALFNDALLQFLRREFPV